MGSKQATAGEDLGLLIEELKKRHQRDLQNLTLTTQPLKTMWLFLFATLQYLRQTLLYVLRKGDWLVALTILVTALGLFLVNGDVSNEKHVQEFLNYTTFGLWWIALGVTSSIGLVEKRPSWLEKDCSEFGPPLYESLPGSLVRVPISSILPQVQLEAILWGLGTALGELPPYFISRAASLSGNKLEMEEFNAASSEEDGFLSAYVNQIKCWLLTHSQYLNFLTILVLASVPNPLFDLAGIMCGQFGIPFWKFFLATLIGKALIKTHIQTLFIISLCNNQLLEWLENELIWVLGLIPGLPSVLPNLIAKLHMVQQKYLSTPVPEPTLTDGRAKQWNLSVTMIWNIVIWLMLMSFFVKIVTATAKGYLKEQQELEMTKKKLALKST